MTQSGQGSCPTKIQLEAFSLGERRELSAHVSTCVHCQGLVAAMNEERQNFLKVRPFSDLWREVGLKRRTSPVARFWEWLMPFGPFKTALAMAGIAGLIVFAVWQQTLPPSLRTKGGVGLGFYVASKTNADVGVEKGTDGMSAAPGTALQFVYSAPADQKYLLLIGVESGGNLSAYYPSPEGDQREVVSEAITPGSNVRLPQALSWLPQTSYERFFAIFSKEPVKLAEVREAVAKLQQQGKSVEEANKLPVPYPQASVLLRKK